MLGEFARWLAMVLCTQFQKNAKGEKKFTLKEQMFMGFAWTPKATV